MCLILYEPSTTKMPDGKENATPLNGISDAPAQWRCLQGIGCLHPSSVHTNIQSARSSTVAIALLTDCAPIRRQPLSARWTIISRSNQSVA